MDSSTSFSILITLFTSYAAIVVSLLIAKNGNKSLSIWPIIAILTAIYLLITFITFVLCLENISFLSFLQNAISKTQSILYEFYETNFGLEHFVWIYLLGLIPLFITGVECSADAIYAYVNLVMKVIDVLFNLFIIIPYFISLLIYHYVYDSSFIATLIVNFIANVLASALLAGAHEVLDCIDDAI